MEDNKLASDIVFLNDLRVDAVVGGDAWERRIAQRLRVDIEMAADVRACAAGDDVGRTIDYDAVASRVRTHAQATNCVLVETLAEGIAGMIREEFGVSWVRLTVIKKGAVRNAAGAGVTIERGERT